jgi:pyruvate formate lyase activating enzyme
LQPILDTIRSLHNMGLWVEIVTLLIPGFNDSNEELTGLAEFLASVSPDIPWHVTAFHKDYKMTDPADTRPTDLLRAVEIGKRAGLRYIYAGNLPGLVGQNENTRCHHCGTTLIRRFAYEIEDYIITEDGKCPGCGSAVPGRWASHFDGQIAVRPFLPRRASSLVTIANRR